MTPPDPDAVTGGHAGGEHAGGEHGGDGRGDGGRGDGGHRSGSAGGRHSALFRAVVAALTILLFLAFVALGTWQVKRRVWKLDLIARVEQRVHAPPVAAPGPAQWPQVSAATDEYRHVTVTGTFLDESQTLVQAVTELGAGYWVLTPLRTADNSIVLVNRGFIPADDRDRVARTALQPPLTTVTGLLRISEPRGAFLRHNDATTNHWYSRDVQAIAAARGLTHVAPYFIDAEPARPSAASGVASPPGVASALSPAPPTGATRAAGTALPTAGTRAAGTALPTAGTRAAGTTPPTGAAPAAGTAPLTDATSAADATPAVATPVVPVAGLTVITFHNSHLVYAITWYTLALMVAAAIWLGIRSETRT